MRMMCVSFFLVTCLCDCRHSFSWSCVVCGLWLIRLINGFHLARFSH